MGKLSFNITGLQEFVITFQEYCQVCPYTKQCKFGKESPFTITIDCKEIIAALDFLKSKEMDKLAKKNPDWDWDTREKKAKVTRAQIYAKLWDDKVKKRKDEIACIDSRKLDSMLTSQRGEEWWSDFRETMSEIDKECSKII